MWFDSTRRQCLFYYWQLKPTYSYLLPTPDLLFIINNSMPWSTAAFPYYISSVGRSSTFLLRTRTPLAHSTCLLLLLRCAVFSFVVIARHGRMEVELFILFYFCISREERSEAHDSALFFLSSSFECFLQMSLSRVSSLHFVSVFLFNLISKQNWQCCLWIGHSVYWVRIINFPFFLRQYLVFFFSLFSLFSLFVVFSLSVYTF